MLFAGGGLPPFPKCVQKRPSFLIFSLLSSYQKVEQLLCLQLRFSLLFSGSDLTNICRHTTRTSTSGHLVSPKFPEMYPNRRNCTCAVSAPPGERMRIGTAFLLVKVKHLVVVLVSSCCIFYCHWSNCRLITVDCFNSALVLPRSYASAT